MSHLTHAETLVTALESVVATAATSLAGRAEKDGRISTALLDEHQTVAYDLASVASAVAAARHLLGYGEKGDHEASLALAYAADVAVDLQGRVAGRASQWGLDGDALADVGEAGARRARPPATRSSSRTSPTRSWPRARPAHGTCPRNSRWCARPSGGSPRTRWCRSPRKCTATTRTSLRT
ncbi:MAG: hypothetical protein WD378_10335 [Egicoccus sp.]